MGTHAPKAAHAMSYDPELRRSTPLAAKLALRISREGPLTVAEYMELCLSDPDHGYYRGQPALGQSGDFVTAPEISQIFGELIGLWAAVVWQQMGAPGRLNLVELGPGRGTLMADALRATRRVPGFHSALSVWLVEPSPVLEGTQRATLAQAGIDVRWQRALAPLPTAPTILLANEVLDVLPIRQFVFTGTQWRERGVGLDDARRLVFVLPDEMCADPPPGGGDAPRIGDVAEFRDVGALAGDLARMASAAPLAGLFIDYGRGAGAGDTFQAVRKHCYEHPLTSPGEADLTALVDFPSIARSLEERGFIAEPLTTQAEFLGALGIVERASRLMSANPAHAVSIETAVARLMAPQGMGTRFNALGVRTPGLPQLPGFHSR